MPDNRFWKKPGNLIQSVLHLYRVDIVFSDAGKIYRFQPQLPFASGLIPMGQSCLQSTEETTIAELLFSFIGAFMP